MFHRPPRVYLSLLAAVPFATIPLWSGSSMRSARTPSASEAPLQLPEGDCIFRVDAQSSAVDIDTDPAHRPHLDILPGKCPNVIKVDQGDDDDDDDDDHHGVELDENGMPLVATLRASILGNAFDVTQIDLGTIGLTRFNPIAPDGGDTVTAYPVLKPLRLEFRDIGTPFEGDTPCGCNTLHGDCALDIDLRFSRNDVIHCFGLDNEANGASIVLRLTARTSGDRGFRITDCVTIRND